MASRGNCGSYGTLKEKERLCWDCCNQPWRVLDAVPVQRQGPVIAGGCWPLPPICSGCGLESGGYPPEPLPTLQSSAGSLLTSPEAGIGLKRTDGKALSGGQFNPRYDGRKSRKKRLTAEHNGASLSSSNEATVVEKEPNAAGGREEG